MAHYRCLPMYEYIRPGIYVQFNQAGEYFTADPEIIAALDACAPFIERVDNAPDPPKKPEKPAEPQPDAPEDVEKSTTKPRANQRKK